MNDDKITRLSDYNEEVRPPLPHVDGAGEYDTQADLLAKLTGQEDIQNGMVVGFTKDGGFIMLPSQMTMKDALWLVEVARRHILQ